MRTQSSTEIEYYQVIQEKITSKQALMMAYEWSKSDQDNFGKFINQFLPVTKTLTRILGKILD